MNKNGMELTDADIVEELKDLVQSLRVALETLLEDSDDEEQEKDTITISLEEISNIFSVVNWKNAENYTQQALSHVEGVSAFGEGDDVNFLLRYCLILDQCVTNFFDRNVITEADIVKDFDGDEDDNNQELNASLLKVLRTLYQKQLLQLIKNTDKHIPLNALNALSRDIFSTVPTVNAKDWLLLSFYLQALLKDEQTTGVETHRLLAKLDGRLASLLANQVIDTEICDDLMNVIRSLQNGSEFIENNVLTQDVYTISSTVYKRFGVALKDEMVKIHEQLERVYLDQAQRLRLEDSIPFLLKLVKVLKFMGLNRLSLLTEDLVKSFQQLLESAMDEAKFNEVVSQFWVLESFLSDLWVHKNQTVPLSYHEMENWAYLNAKHSALKLFISEYRKISEQITSTTDTEILQSLQQKLFNAVKAESLLSIANGLTRYFVDDFMVVTLSQASLVEIALAVEYICNMNFENRPIDDGVLNDAREMLQQHQLVVSQLSPQVVEQGFDADLIAALQSDLNDLEAELDGCITQVPLEDSSYEKLIRIAHTLRGNANIMRLDKVVQETTALEEDLRANQWSYNADQLAAYYRSFGVILEQFKVFF